MPPLAVALLTECVDRNRSRVYATQKAIKVALLTECVDRNNESCQALGILVVALLTECVDRNVIMAINKLHRDGVALLTECVDRNYIKDYVGGAAMLSHSLRSAWIEISPL